MTETQLDELIKDKIRILQIYPDRGRAATLLAKKTFLDDFDIALVQEPYPRHIGKGKYAIYRKDSAIVAKAEIWARAEVKASIVENPTTEAWGLMKTT